jgi:hypothetical protein
MGIAAPQIDALDGTSIAGKRDWASLAAGWDNGMHAEFFPSAVSVADNQTVDFHWSPAHTELYRTEGPRCPSHADGILVEVSVDSGAP